MPKIVQTMAVLIKDVVYEIKLSKDVYGFQRIKTIRTRHVWSWPHSAITHTSDNINRHILMWMRGIIQTKFAWNKFTKLFMMWHDKSWVVKRTFMRAWTTWTNDRLGYNDVARHVWSQKREKQNSTLKKIKWSMLFLQTKMWCIP